MKYRREIDGLRSIAVLPVIFFHAGFSVFSGGFVGVDIFFVISGYLITTILLSELDQGKFSLINFYERRARRILPALFLVMITSTIFAYFLLTPSHMVDFSQSLVAISLFSSNILFWQESGYWGVENELKPLLHTWSLAVEEQYYVLFPIFLILMWKLRKRWIFLSFLLITLLSFCMSEYFSTVKPIANFFLLPTRGWELAIGSIVAFLILYKRDCIDTILKMKFIDELLSLCGMVLIGYAIFVFDERTNFPGVYALVPTIGTAFIIIFANKETFIGRILGSKILVGIGLLSYSAYLWHQPIFAFAKHATLIHPSKTVLFFLSILSMVLATISWKYIEAPFRNKSNFNRRQVFQLSLFGSLVFIIVGLLVTYSGGMQNRFTTDLRDFNSIKDKNEPLNYAKTLNKLNYQTDTGTLNALIIGNEQLENDSFVVWGDSHASAMLPAIHKSAINNDAKGTFVAREGCLPFKGAAQVTPSYYDSCLEQNAMVLDFISSNPNIKKVILISRWAIYAMGERFEREYGRTVFIKDELTTNESLEENRKVFIRSAVRTFSKLKELGLEITIVRQVPEVEFNVPNAHAKILMFGNDVNLEPSFDSYVKRNLFVNNTFEELADEFDISFINPHETMCNPNRCEVFDSNSTPIYRDTNHIMPFYSEKISFIFDNALKTAR